MGLFNIIDPILDFAFNPLLRLNPIFGIAVVSLTVTLLITLIYKVVTDQKLMKELKDRQKHYNKKIKEARSDPQQAMKIQKEAMSVSMEYMRHSFKPMFLTLIPIIIIFGWLSSHFAYLPIQPDEEFNTSIYFNGKHDGFVTLYVPEEMALLSEPEQDIIDKKASWTLKGPAGEYILTYEYGAERYSKNLLITDTKSYAPTTIKRRSLFDYIYSSGDGFVPTGSSVTLISIDNKPLKPLPFRILGWHPGWLGTYIMISICLSIIVRKLLKVH